MKHAIKYDFNAGLFYLCMKKHFCPQCKSRLKRNYFSEIVNSKSPEAKAYDFSVGETFYKGNVEFRTICFLCDNCKRNYSIHELKDYERKTHNM